MIKNLAISIVILALIFGYFLNIYKVSSGNEIKIVAYSNGVEKTVFEENVFKSLYWNRAFSMVLLDGKLNILNTDNRFTFYSEGLDFYIAVNESDNNLLLISKRTGERSVLKNSMHALTMTNSNLFVLTEKNGLVFYFYHFVPLEDRVYEVKSEVFSSFMTSYFFSKNSYNISFMNGDIYIFNPFDNKALNLTNSISKSSLSYAITATLDNEIFTYIYGYEKQYLEIFNKSGKNLAIIEKSNDHEPFLCLSNEHQILYRDGEFIRVYDLKKSSEKASMKQEGVLLDYADSPNHMIVIIKNNDSYFLLFYDKRYEKVHVKQWRYPIERINSINKNDLFSLYSKDNIWIIKAR